MGSKRTLRERPKDLGVGKGPNGQAHRRLRDGKYGRLGFSERRTANARGYRKTRKTEQNGLHDERGKQDVVRERFGASVQRDPTFRLDAWLPCWRTLVTMGATKLPLERYRFYGQPKRRYCRRLARSL